MRARTIKVVRDDIGDLDKELLEQVEAKLIRAKVSNAHMEVSFTFVQRLISEVLRRRREERELDREVAAFDLLPEPEEFILEDYDSSPLRLSALEDESTEDLEVPGDDPAEEEEESGIDEEEELPTPVMVAPRRTRLVSRQPRSGISSVSFVRVSVLSILFILIMVIWVIVFG